MKALALTMIGVALSSVAAVPVKTQLSQQPRRVVTSSTRSRNVTKHVTTASFVDTGYALADAASKVADQADKVAAKAGSVDAPGWVLPVA